jgi:hypothetical protein
MLAVKLSGSDMTVDVGYSRARQRRIPLEGSAEYYRFFNKESRRLCGEN